MQIYRTPFMLRYCCSVLVHLGAVVLGPYFQHIGKCIDNWTTEQPIGCPAPYIMACIYGVICMLLINVQAAAEMPFDMTGLDDVFFELANEFSDIIELGSVEPIGDSGWCFAPGSKAAGPQPPAGRCA
eukprot:GHRR01030901.1.p1 GENE.GHRR01030901.1~~GHRR01030901.1.p1  ORF type:complete len:128 (+),score=25.41 GHRR01030901.1:464-847(+)